MSIFITRERDALGTTTGIRVIVILAMMKRLEQLESTHGIIEMGEYMVHFQTLLNDLRRSRIKILKEQTYFKSQSSLKDCYFLYCVFLPPRGYICRIVL